MIQFSFSPNWYRPQSMAFSRHSTRFYYSSNCILYQYDLKQKKILNQLNLKDFLLKDQGYSLSSLFKQNNSFPQKNQQQKSANKQKFDEKSQSEKEKQKILKISAIQSIQNQLGTFLMIGFNCIGILLLIEFSQIKATLKVRQVIDISTHNSEFYSSQYIYIKRNQQKKQVERHRVRDLIQEIVVFSPELIHVIIPLKFSLQNSDVSIEKFGLKINNLLKSENSDNRNRNQKIKLISIEQFNSKTNFIEGESVDQTQIRQILHVVFLQLGVKRTQESTKTHNNIVIFDQNFQKIIHQINLESLTGLIQNTLLQKNPNQQTSILSSDNIEIYLNNQTINKYAILSKNHFEKANLFCQKFQLFTFNSNLFLFLFPESQQQKKLHNQNPQISRVTIQIIYPKKCHHKLSQNHKSTLSIKFVNHSTLLLTGKLGQIFVLNLKQIQFKLQKTPSHHFTLTLRPYSYEQDKNLLWFLEPNQKHYKDIYAIYRVSNQKSMGDTLKSQKIKSEKQQKTDEIQSFIHMIGTDHILTTWRISGNQQNSSIQDSILFESSLKFLTSAVEQIVFSQPQPSLVFLRLKDSNMRSFEPFSDKGYWLNEFWKHTCNSFGKEIQKVVMHSTEIGLACMVNKDSKIVLYDLYEQRLVRLIQIREKVKPKFSESAKTNINQSKNNNFKDKKPESQQKELVIRSNNTAKKSGNEKSKNEVELRALKINSISFEHVSIIKAIQALYSSEELTEHIMQDETIKESFDFSFQSFYQRQMDRNVVLLIQSNEYIVVIRQLSQQYQPKRFHVYRKVFKLERVYKTKYWDGEFMLGTRKKKGQLHVAVLTKIQQHGQKTQNESSEYHRFVEEKVELPLGTSSRYLFKLSSFNSKLNKENNAKLLSVINYKGTKLVILIYRLSLITTHQKLEKELQQSNGEKIGKKSEIKDNLLMEQLFSSEEIQLSSQSSLNSSLILIENLVISQEEDEFLIAIYNNQSEVINVVDFKHLVDQIVHAKEQPIQSLIKSRKESAIKLSTIASPKRNLTSLYPKILISDGQVQSSHPLIESEQSAKVQKNQNDILPEKYLLRMYQEGGLSYKVQSIAFHKAHQTPQNEFDGSHLIILGKDQSVRLLPLTLFQSHTDIEVTKRKT